MQEIFVSADWDKKCSSSLLHQQHFTSCIRGGTDRSGNGRREGAIVHVGVVHVAHHDVAWVARVRVAFTVQVLEFSWFLKQKTKRCLQKAHETFFYLFINMKTNPTNENILTVFQSSNNELFRCCNHITVDRFNPCPILPRPFVCALSSRLGEEGRIMQRNNGAPLCQLAPIRRTYRLCQNRRRPNCSSMPLTWEGEFYTRGLNAAPLATQLRAV